MLPTEYVLGIDPGSKGAFCLLTPESEATFYDMPNSPTSWRLLYRRLLGKAPEIVLVGFEDVHSLYGMSAKSNFQFGGWVKQAELVTRMALDNYTDFELIQPKQWQKEIGLSFPKGSKPTDRKKLALAHALDLFGQQDFYGPRGGILDGRVDAYLIAQTMLRRIQDAKTTTSTS